MIIVGPSKRLPEAWVTARNNAANRNGAKKEVKGVTGVDIGAILKGMRDDTTDAAKKMGYVVPKFKFGGAKPPVADH